MLGCQKKAEIEELKNSMRVVWFCYCYALCLKIPVQSVPSSKSQTLAPQCLLPRQLRPSKGVQSSCRSTWHRGTWFETQQWQRAVVKSTFYTSNDEKTNLRAAAGAHCVTRKSVGERSWWQNKWWKSMERWESMEIIHNIHWYTATRYKILYNDI